MAVQRPATALPAHVLERADMRDAISRHDFGTVFVLARKWAGISYSKIAEACGIKPERVGTLARGEGSITTYEKITRIADALRIPGHMLGLAPRSWEHALINARPTVATLHVSAGLEPNGYETVLRRDFLREAALGTGLALAGPGSVPAGGRIELTVPVQLRPRPARPRR